MLLQSGLRDAWVEKVSGTGYTRGTAEFDLRSPSQTVDERIDYLLFNPGTHGKSGPNGSGTCSIGKGMATEGGCLWPSDHFGVLGTFRFEETGSDI
jgi:hypothetical protein